MYSWQSDSNVQQSNIWERESLFKQKKKEKRRRENLLNIFK